MIWSLAAILILVAVAAGSFVAGARPVLGLDLQGGISAALQPDPEGDQPDDMDRALDLAVDLIRQRVNGLGVAEPDVARQGDDTILVQLPGITDAERAKSIIGQTAQLTFHPVINLVIPGTPEYAATPPCVEAAVADDGEPILDDAGEPVYTLSPNRPKPTVPVSGDAPEAAAFAGNRYVCDDLPDPGAVEPAPVDTGADAPDLQDLIDASESETVAPTDPASDAATDSATAPEATDEPTTDTTEAPSEEPSGDALGQVNAAAEGDASEAPDPDATDPATDAPTDEPTADPTDSATDDPTDEPTEPTDADDIFGDGLPLDAPRPLKYLVGCIPTDQGIPDGGAEDPDCQSITGVEDGDGTPDTLTGDDIEDAFPSIDVSGWVVQLSLDGDGGDAFREATSALACQRDAGGIGQLAIVLDDVIKSAPNMSANVQCGVGIAGGSATITVGQTDPAASEREAKDLALVLDVGALPLTLKEANFQSVSPSLGSAALRSGVIAGLIGLLLVGMYLTYFYRLLGVIAIGGLAIYGILVFGVITLMGEVGFALTLAGVAGIVVAIGITADSSIIFFERIRDELNLGKTMRTAASRGFDSAFRTNLAGNTVTLAAALILYFLAVGPVRGFAFTLGVATILDILIMWAYTRSVVGLLAGAKRLTRKSVRVDEAAIEAAGGAA